MTQDAARVALLRLLDERGYAFTTPAPSTHWRVRLRRGLRVGNTLDDVFGWSMGFDAQGPLAFLMEPLRAAGLLGLCGGRARSLLRVARVGPLLFYHSAFPARAKNAVFLGPDSYAFARFIEAKAPPLSDGAAILDIGTGAGVGGITAGRARPHARLVLSDVNQAALDLARVNAAFAGQTPELAVAKGMPPGDDRFDLILANPPYLGAGPSRTYSDGGAGLGSALTLAWTRQALPRLTLGGRFLLYSGAAMVEGRDPLREALAVVAQEAGCTVAYEELDPDVFPSTLLHPPYWGVERIAAIGAVFTRPG